MAPLTKDPVGVPDAATSIAEVPNPQANAAPAQPRPANPAQQQSGQLRADAVSLEIPVKVHGSRVAGAAAQTEPFEEETSTMIVFPQGAVVRMATAVNAGQMLVLTNSRSRQDAICRVVKIRTFSSTQAYVEIEFTHPQPNYWGTQPAAAAPGATASKPTAPAAPTSAPKVASAPPAAAPPKPKPEAAVPDVSWAPARPASPHAATPVVSAPAKPAAPAPSAGNPPVQQIPSVPVSSTAERSEAARDSVKEPPKKPVAIDFPSAPDAKPLPSLTMQELLGDEAGVEAAVAAAIPTESHAAADSTSGSRAVFGSFAASAALSSHHAASTEDSALRIDLGLGDESAAPKEKNWLLIAAVIALVFAGAVAGIMYVRQHMGGSAATSESAKNAAPGSSNANSASVVREAERNLAEVPPASAHSTPAANVPANHAAAVPSAAMNAPAGNAPSAAASAPPSAPANSNASSSSEGSHVASNPANPPAAAPPTAPDASQPNAAEPPSKPAVTSDMVASTLNAHPITSQRADTGDTAAPSIDAGSAGGAEPTITMSSNMPTLAVPDAGPAGPVRVGGQVKEPKLISYRQPIYPGVAKQTHVDGDVIIDTNIDKKGNVVGMKVVSGPTVLRQAALDALQQWKYQPSTLDGQPVAIQMLVTIKFRF